MKKYSTDFESANLWRAGTVLLIFGVSCLIAGILDYSIGMRSAFIRVSFLGIVLLLFGVRSLYKN